MPGRKGGNRFTAKGDRMAQHVADSYGGSKQGLSIGYAVATKRGLLTSSAKKKVTNRGKTSRKK